MSALTTIGVTTTGATTGSANATIFGICSNDEHGVVDFIAALIYLPMTVWGVTEGVKIFVSRGLIASGIVLMLVTLTCLVGSLVLRCIWFFLVCLAAHHGWVASMISVMSMLLFFSAFSVYVYSWAQSLNKNHAVTQRNVTLYGNIAVYVTIIIFAMVLAVTTTGQDFMEGEPGGDAILIIVAMCDLLLCVAFAAYGACALKLMRQVREQTRTKASDQLGWRVYVV